MPSPWLIGVLLLLAVCHHASAIKCVSADRDQECVKCYIRTDDNKDQATVGCVTPLMATIPWTNQQEDQCMAQFEHYTQNNVPTYHNLLRTKVCSNFDYCNARCGNVQPLKCLTNFEDYWTPIDQDHPLVMKHMRKVVDPYVKQGCVACVRYQGFMPGYSVTKNDWVVIAKDKVYYDCLTNDITEYGSSVQLLGKKVANHECRTMTINDIQASYYRCMNKDLCNAWCGAASIPMMHLVMGVVCALGFVVMRR